jgi:putative endonuclease
LHWEQSAAELLQRHGMTILGRNLKRQTGEIDLVALEPGGTLVFVEVRHRAHRQFGRAADTVQREKQLRLIRTAQLLLPGLCRRYLAGHVPPCRFDIIGFDGTEPVWLRAAFSL